MKLVKTYDNSYTFYSEKYSETYNSTSGALEESLKKFVEPCGIKDGMNILDIGFGLGYNIGMALFKAKNLKIVSLENDPFILRTVHTIEAPYWFRLTYEKVKAAARHLRFDENGTNITVILGDAQETIKKIFPTKDETKFDAVFLDPFSHTKNPELWTIEFFTEIKRRMKKGAVMATYSCAGIVRRNLKSAGFEVKDGPSVGRRAPGTIAVNE